jgi:hypothetical protein
MTFTFTAVVKATAAKFNFAACSRHAKCLFRVRLHTKDLVIGGWVGLGQLLVAARQTVQRNNVLIIVYLLLNRLKCQILRTWN